MNNYYSIAYKINVQSQVCSAVQAKEGLTVCKNSWQFALSRQLESNHGLADGRIL